MVTKVVIVREVARWASAHRATSPTTPPSHFELLCGLSVSCFAHSVQDVVLVTTRRIMKPPKKGSAQQRPRSRTLTAVHEAVLEDLVYPTEIVGKRLRFRLDGSRIIKVSAERRRCVLAH